jgi:hypothetical protein
MRSRARQNRALGVRSFSGVPVDESLSLSDRDIQRGLESGKSWHWGLPTQRVVDCHDPDMPPMLVECGRLIRLHVRAPRGNRKAHPLRVRDSMIEFSKAVSPRCHIAFDPNHPAQRLYIVLPVNVRKVIKQRFWDQNQAQEVDLNQLAAIMGGTHGRMLGYPHVAVKPVGILTAIVYATAKQGDGQSFYIHAVAEVSSQFPALAIDGKGRLWVAGGSTTSPTAGISD